MATIGWIKIGTAVDISGLAKGASAGSAAMARMKGSSNSLTAAFVTDFANLKRQALAFASVAGAIGLVRASFARLRESTHILGDLGDMSERTGVSIHALSKLSYVGKLSGMTMETLGTALEKMNMRLAEVAIEGSGPTADALKRLGLSAQALIAMGPEKALEKLLRVLEAIKNPMERNKVAMDLFGKSGQGMINLALKGASGLRDIGREAEALGVAISEVDAQKLGEVDDAFDRIGAAVQGVSNTLAIELQPYIVAATNAFIDWMKSGTDGVGMIHSAMVGFIRVVGGTGDAIQAVGMIGQVAWDVITIAFQGAMEIMLKGVDVLLQAVAYVGNSLLGLHIQVTDLAGTWGTAFGEAADETIKHMKSVLDQPWFSQGVNDWVATLNAKSDKRNWDKTKGPNAASIGPGSGKPEQQKKEHEFAGAFEFGSHEAYSATLKSRGAFDRTTQNRIEVNTRRSAEATERSANALATIASSRAQFNRQGDLATAGK